MARAQPIRAQTPNLTPLHFQARFLGPELRFPPARSSRGWWGEGARGSQAGLQGGLRGWDFRGLGGSLVPCCGEGGGASCDLRQGLAPRGGGTGSFGTWQVLPLAWRLGVPKAAVGGQTHLSRHTSWATLDALQPAAAPAREAEQRPPLASRTRPPPPSSPTRLLLSQEQVWYLLCPGVGQAGCTVTFYPSLPPHPVDLSGYGGQDL